MASPFFLEIRFLVFISDESFFSLVQIQKKEMTEHHSVVFRHFSTGIRGSGSTVSVESSSPQCHTPEIQNFYKNQHFFYCVFPMISSYGVPAHTRSFHLEVPQRSHDAAYPDQPPDK